MVAASLDKISEESRASFFQRHAELRAQGEAVGEQLPEISGGGVPAATREAVQTAEAEPVSPAHPSCQTAENIDMDSNHLSMPIGQS